MIGQIIGGRYQIIRELATGGMGQTYLAEDTQMGSVRPKCVVKQLKYKDTKLKKKFEEEARTLHELGQQNDQIPQLYAFFSEENSQDFYLVQEFIDGQLLSNEITEDNHWSETDVWLLLQEVLSILVFVHSQGKTHLDIKPSNIIRRHQDGKLVLIDFGAVKQLQLEDIELQTQVSQAIPPTNAGIPSTHHKSHTTSVVIGTLGYMPPEQQRGKPRFSSDLYALGMMAIQALTGISPNKLPEDSQDGEIIWRDRVNVSNELGDFLTKMTRYHFKERYQTAAEAFKALPMKESPSEPDPSPSFTTPKKTVVTPRKNYNKWAIFGASISLLIASSSWGFSELQHHQKAKSFLDTAKNFKDAENYSRCREYTQNTFQGLFVTDINAEAQSLNSYCTSKELWSDIENLNESGNLVQAVEKAYKIIQLTNAPDQDKALNLIFNSVPTITQQAKEKYVAGNLDKAVEIMQIITTTLSSEFEQHQNTQNLINQWTREWGANESHYNKAQEQLGKQKWNNAIDLANKLTTDYWQEKGQSIINEANNGLNEYYKTLLQTAKTTYNSGNLQEGISKLNQIPSNAEVYRQAQNLRQEWSAEWNRLVSEIEEFIESYFDKITKGNYRTAWNQHTYGSQQKVNGGYESFADYWRPVYIYLDYLNINQTKKVDGDQIFKITIHRKPTEKAEPAPLTFPRCIRQTSNGLKFETCTVM